MVKQRNQGLISIIHRHRDPTPHGLKRGIRPERLIERLLNGSTGQKVNRGVIAWREVAEVGEEKNGDAHGRVVNRHQAQARNRNGVPEGTSPSWMGNSSKPSVAAVWTRSPEPDHRGIATFC